MLSMDEFLISELFLNYKGEKEERVKMGETKCSMPGGGREAACWEDRHRDQWSSPKCVTE